MLRALSFVFPASLLVSTAPALSHPGHLGALAGHDHWVAGAAIGLAIALGLWGALKGKKTEAAAPEEETEDGTPEEATA
jgi:hypothetical protein